MATTNMKKRLSVNDMRKEDTDSLFVFNKASSIHKVPAHLLLPHTSSQSGDPTSIEIPMTFNPVDLSTYAPKNELLNNTQLLRMINTRALEFVFAQEAEELLATEEGIAETERLEADRIRRFAGVDHKAEGDFKVVQPPQNLQPPNPGQLNMETNGISPTVVAAITDENIENTHRASLLRNMLPQMTPEDKKWVRKNTNDPAIRKMVAI